MLGEQDRKTLLEVARRAIEHGVRTGERLQISTEGQPEALVAHKGCFVTLRIGDDLRGCVGSLQPRGPLIDEVARAAFMAAFRDPRFPPLAGTELDRIHIHVSVLSLPEPLVVASERDLLQKLRPGIDGLILEDGSAMSTFLPDVWESLPGPEQFVAHLKRKAGLPAHHWSPTIAFKRYTTESFE
jgi:AmmeMemoRadiSam system protein A